jgi:glyceraldehyde 3-phosphate dehydrogenase
VAVTVAINGFGRIGRACARIIATEDRLKIIEINDLVDRDTLLYLFRHDTVHGGFNDSFLRQVRFSRAKEPEGCRFDAELVLECTGVFLTRNRLQTYIDRGAKRVMLSAMPKDDILVVAPLASSDEPIISAGSCSTNALWLMSDPLERAFGIEALIASSIHSYTSDQRLLDARHDEARRGRACGINIIPVISNAASNLWRIDAAYRAKAKAIALRVPVPNGSIMQATYLLKKDADATEINAVFEKESELLGKEVLDTAGDHKVLTDIISTYASAIIDLPLTSCRGRLASVSAWHDNETGYASRVVDLAVSVISV